MYGELPLNDHRWMPFESSVSVPAFGVMQGNGAVWPEGQIVTQISKPAGVNPDAVLYLNGPSPLVIPEDGTVPKRRGRCVTAIEDPWWALYYDRDPTPLIGEEWGPVSGQWYLRRNKPGFRVVAIDSDNGRVLVLRTPEASYRHFELDESIFHGNSALGYWREWNGMRYVTDASDPAERVSFKDVWGQYRGRGRNDMPSPDDHGSYGKAVWKHSQWEIVDLQHHAVAIVAVTLEAFTESDQLIPVSAVSVTAPVSEALLMRTVTSVGNLFSWRGAAGEAIVAHWQDGSELGEWAAWQKDCFQTATP